MKKLCVLLLLPCSVMAQHKITDYTNSVVLTSNQFFLVTSADGLTNAKANWGQITNQLLNGGPITNLNATQLLSGTVPDARLSGNVFLAPLDVVTNNRTGDLTLANVTATALTITTFNVTTQNVGTLVLTNLDGSFWTNLNGTEIRSGTVAAARIGDLSASYEAHVATLTNLLPAANLIGTVPSANLPTGILTNNWNGGDIWLTNNLFIDPTKSYSGNGGGLTSLNAASLSIGIVAGGRLSGPYNSAIVNATNIQSGGALSATVMPALTGDVTTSAGAVATTLAVVPRTMTGNTGGALIGANVTCYYAPSGNSITNIQTSDVSAQTRNELSQSINNITLYVRTSAAVGSGKTDTITVFTNGVSTGIQVAITGTSQTTGNATGTINSLAAGNEIGLQINTQSASTPVKWSWSLKVK